MTTLEQQTAADFATELRENVIAIELMLQRVGRRRSMSDRHRAEVADHFGAQRRAVGGSKRLYAPNQPEIKRIAGVLSDVRRSWLDRTIGYRRGIRLLRKDQLERWIDTFGGLQDALRDALAAADDNHAEILDASREFLGAELFDRSDYPASFVDSISIAWGVHNFEPSEELLRLAPETYQREQERVRRQFAAALSEFERESREQLQTLVESLLEKLTAAESGKKVVYTEAATTNLRDFFDRFESLNIRSDETLTELVEVARRSLGGTTMQDLKRNAGKRRSLAQTFEDVSEKLGSLIAEAPARSIDLEELD